LPDGSIQKLGWITLPSFYQDMEKSRTGKSTSRDVAALLKRLQQEQIQGLVVDLRRDGGGSLDEAIKMSGLFINQGPVVQVKDANGDIDVLKDREGSALYSGPMIVLVNKLSASASEIFAAAMQDYGRALIVGDSSTFGKGTVQTMLELGRFMPMLGNDAVRLPLRMRKQLPLPSRRNRSRNLSALPHVGVGIIIMRAPNKATLRGKTGEKANHGRQHLINVLRAKRSQHRAAELLPVFGNSFPVCGRERLEFAAGRGQLDGRDRLAERMRGKHMPALMIGDDTLVGHSCATLPRPASINMVRVGPTRSSN